MKIIVEIEGVTGGYSIEVHENDVVERAVTMETLRAVATTKKSAARRAGALIERALGEEK